MISIYDKIKLVVIEMSEIMENKIYTGYPTIDRRHEDGATYFEKNPLIPNISIYKAFKYMNVMNSDNYAIDCLDERITYRELMNNINQIAKSFKELGIKEKDIIPVSTPSFIQAVIVYFAANKIGATTTFLNYKSTDTEIKRYLNLFESPIFINYNKNYEENKSFRDSTKVRTVITLNSGELGNLRKNEGNIALSGNSDYISYNEFNQIGKYYKNIIKTSYGSNQDSLILFTSGTTGNPKSIVLTNGNILSSAIYMKNSTRVPLNKGEKCLVTVPFNYPYGFVTSTLMTLLCGKEAILAPDLTTRNIDKYLMKEPNYIFAIPPFYSAMRNNEKVKDMDLPSITAAISGGDFYSEMENIGTVDFLRDHGSSAYVYNGSGAGETSGANTNGVGLEYNPKTVGKPLVGAKVKVIDPVTKEELKYGEVGLLCYSGKYVFDRYYGDPEGTSKVKIKDENGVEWYVSDTYGILTEDGYQQIVGRDRRFFITFDETGEPYKVYCNFVQECICSLSFVETCGVVEKPDAIRSKVPVLYVVLKKGVEMTDEIKCILDNLKDVHFKLNGVEGSVTLKSYEIPTIVNIIEELPLTEAKKVDYLFLENEALKIDSDLKSK